MSAIPRRRVRQLRALRETVGLVRPTEAALSSAVRFVLAVAVLALALAAWSAPQAQRAPRRALVKLAVLTHPTHDFPPSLERAIAEGLRAELQVEVESLPRRPLPEAAYYAPRRRYRADALLDHLRPLLGAAPEDTKVLGFTAADISTTARGRFDWGVFGLGDLGGRAAVLSTFRLRRRARDDAHFTFRVVTTAVHEIGHTLGLEHCTEARCVMQDAHGSIATVDGSDGHLGPACRARVDGSAPLR